MSANNQIIVAPFPGDLEKYAVWHDYCVDDPFDFGKDPMTICATLDEGMEAAEKACERFGVEYGIRFISRHALQEYREVVWLVPVMEGE